METTAAVRPQPLAARRGQPAAARPAAQAREVWLDRLKGLLILSVVIGHILPGPYNTLDQPAAYLFLFHLPAFFMVSGYLYRESDVPLGRLIAKRARRILVPYALYLLLIAGSQLAWAALNGYNTRRFWAKKIPALLLGGQELNQFYCGALWFLTASFTACALFYLVEKTAARLPVRLGIYLAFWAFAHWEAVYLIRGTGPTPWLWDVGFIGCCYMAMGRYLKPLLFRRWACAAAAVLLAVLLALRLLGVSAYLNGFAIELWSHTHRYPLLDFAVPFAGFVLLANLSRILPARGLGAALCSFGRYTIPIMALHQSVVQVCRAAGIENPLVLWVLAAGIPYLIGRFILENIPPLRACLL